MNDFKSSLPVSDPLSIFCLFQISRIYSVGLYAQLEVDIKSYTNSLIETIFFFKKMTSSYQMFFTSFQAKKIRDS